MLLEDIGPYLQDWSIFATVILGSIDCLRIVAAALSLSPPIKNDVALLFREMASAKDSLLVSERGHGQFMWGLMDVVGM